MKVTNCFFLILALILSMAIVGRVAYGEEVPSEVVYRLYRDFAWEAVIASPEESKAVFGSAIADQPRSVLERYFDTNLSDLLIKDANCTRSAKGEVCNLDFDPIFASQDPAAYNLTIHELTSGSIGVEFIYPPNGKGIQLEYKVKRSNKGWRISDIVFKSNGNSSLKAILQQK